jgi:putative membrane protein
MKRNLIFLFAILALIAFGCKKNENANTDTASTYGSTTSTSSTDTSATTSTTGTSSTSSASLSDADKDFMNKAAIGGMFEVNAGQLAATKATNPDVKNFGNRMVTDHGKANDELKSLATNKGVTLPADLDAEHKKEMDDLSAKNGKAFDKAYMTEMVKDHDKDVAEFQKESTAAQDPDLKNWVTKTLPVIQDHDKMAKDIAKKLK